MVKWTPKSEEDLGEIAEYITKNFNVELAMSTIYGLVEYVESTLTKNPLAGKLLESNPLFSQIIFDGNSIYYTENPKDKNIYVIYVQPRQTKFRIDRLSDDEVA